MKPQEVIFWLIVGILVGTLLLLVANQLLLNILEVDVYIKSTGG